MNTKATVTLTVDPGVPLPPPPLGPRPVRLPPPLPPAPAGQHLLPGAEFRRPP